MTGLHDASALRDKSIIITGGASGLGLATATHFAKAGAYVTIADVQDIPGHRIAHDLNLQGHHVSYVHCDVTDWLSSVLAFKHAALFGPGGSLDVVGLFAGVAGDGGSLTDQVMMAAEPSLDPGHIPSEPTLSAIRVNLEGLYKNAWLALYYMQLPPKTGYRRPFSKSLILVSSLAGYSDMPGNTDYNASKFGVRGIFRGLRHTTSRLGVRVNLIAPFWISTPLSQQQMTEMASVGMMPGDGFSFASIDDCVNVATKLATEADVNGRAFTVVQEGYLDMDDDDEGSWAGAVLTQQWELTRSI
ncbi:hypothetical protein PV04_02336 [Phialophora macrospora]|uniref:Uncharacterized protein n=1 Tax=Phialophora macrospora TaxID=1851006 RepID=A0A0D2FU43_9EURO|nr:hypothetical protein PV04_02336 [Phialophora macrospora]